ncbi:Mur ligase [Trametes versicolor FP-101664 SS1]|uniref:Mur ligase n=1 Tax=Trametes versicolor (strain FP-101664) TaxID=717944 RepID=R7S7D2_TRAVS|nr:Mur ligase [Trametes versicolor FP-101664 SS1]EIW51512.1 Mur ligase [Trametes versicolor FP-101664 SS1]
MSIDLSLDRIKRLLGVLAYTRPTIHIAGTNGKGSVCALVSSILTAAEPALAIGRFNSPHLISVLDSISIKNRPISEEAYFSAKETVERTDKENTIGASNFELLTCTALVAFEHAAVDVVILEVGMGGRLDATNAVSDDCILVSALTAVDLDHQAFLGNTVGAIAREKSAISRPGRPFVIGPQVHSEVTDVARSVVAAVGGEVIPLPIVTRANWDDALDGPPPPRDPAFEGASPRLVQVSMACFTEPVRALLPLHGAHQLANLRVAAGIISAVLTHSSCEKFGLGLRDRITPTAVARGIANTRWPGRLSYHTLTLPAQAPAEPSGAQKLLVLADGAHNPASATALAEYLTELLGESPQGTPNRPLVLTFVLALSHSPPKTPAQTLAPLFALRERLPRGRQVRIGAALLRFTPPAGMPWVRPEPPSVIRAAISTLVPSPGSTIDLWPDSDANEAEAAGKSETALERALRWAAGRHAAGREDALVVLAGSLYLVADFYRLLASLGQAQEIWGAN